MTLRLGDNTLVRRMEFPGRPPLPEQERIVHRNAVSPGFFSTLGTPLLLGRDFDQRDRPGSVRTVIVNQAFVNKYFAGENPIGRVIVETPDPYADPAPLEIIGVVGDAIYRSAREAAPPTMYWSLNRLVRPPSSLKLVVRAATASPTSLARSISAAVMGGNSDLPPSVPSPADQMNAAITQERLVATLSGFFGLLALIIAALGLYGITAYAVTQRHVELGIRMALGTTPAGVVRLVLSRLALLVGSGVAIGGVVSVWATTFI